MSRAHALIQFLIMFLDSFYAETEKLVDDLIKSKFDEKPQDRKVEDTDLQQYTHTVAQILLEARKTHREAYRKANKAHTSTLSVREHATTARNARLNRDWYKHHVEADIESYEQADLDFNPPDLITLDELVSTLNPTEAEVLSQLSPKELMPKRFHHEHLARLRAWGQVTQKQSTKKTLQAEMLRALAKEDAMDKDIAAWCASVEDIAKKHSIDLTAAREKREAPLLNLNDEADQDIVMDDSFANEKEQLSAEEA